MRGPDFTYESLNPAYQALVPGEPIAGRTVADVWPEEAPLLLPLLNVVREAGTVYHATEALIQRRSTPATPVEYRYFDFSYVPLAGPGVDDVQILVNAIEVTAYKRAADELRVSNQALASALAQTTVLLKEIHHRVKNNLAVISSLLSMEADTVEIQEAKEALEESQRRVFSIALIHQQLYGSDNLDRISFPEYARQLVEQLRSSFVAAPEQINVLLDVAPIEMGIHRALPCALILNELVSNAFKHVFPGALRGEVRVSLRESAPDCLELAVADNGIGSSEGLAERNERSLG
jgi:two-component sensor histidine kinase